jgi:hypothetical protein
MRPLRRLEKSQDSRSLIPIQRIPRNLPSQRDQLRRFVKLEKPAHPLRHVDQDVRRIAGDLVLRQGRLHHLETLVDQVQQ